MKKDIVIPEVKDVYMVAIYDWNNDFNQWDWYVYLINTTDEPLEMPMVVSQAQGIINGEMRLTSELRHSFKEVKPHTAIRVEYLTPDVLVLQNEFFVTFFLNGKLFDKKYIFLAGSINETALIPLPEIDKKGILAQ
jgi:hypothetical protein